MVIEEDEANTPHPPYSLKNLCNKTILEVSRYNQSALESFFKAAMLLGMKKLNFFLILFSAFLSFSADQAFAASLGFPARALVCDNYLVHFEAILDAAQATGKTTEGQPNFTQHVDWEISARKNTAEVELGALVNPGSLQKNLAQAIQFDGDQTGYYSPSLAKMVGNWLWVPNASDVYVNEGIVPAQSNGLSALATDGRSSPMSNSLVLRMSSAQGKVNINISTGNEGASATKNFVFTLTQCQAQ